MILLNVVEVKQFGRYVLEDEKKNQYSLSFQFFGSDNLSKGDKVYLDEKYLDKTWENFSQPYVFSAIKEDLVKKVDNFDDSEFISVYYTSNKNTATLKRIYG